jgi:hypothetical protein
VVICFILARALSLRAKEAPASHHFPRRPSPKRGRFRVFASNAGLRAQITTRNAEFPGSSEQLPLGERTCVATRFPSPEFRC